VLPFAGAFIGLPIAVAAAASSYRRLHARSVMVKREGSGDTIDNHERNET